MQHIKNADEPTNRQREIIQFVVQYLFENLYQPSIREIGDRFSISSTNGIVDHLRALQRKGFITEGKFSSPRALRLTSKALRLVKCSDHLRARPIIFPEETCGS